MASDFNKPVVGSNYATFPTEIRDNMTDVAKMFEGTTGSNIPTGAKQLSTDGILKRYNGSSWIAMGSLAGSTTYYTSNTATGDYSGRDASNRMDIDTLLAMDLRYRTIVISHVDSTIGYDDEIVFTDSCHISITGESASGLSTTRGIKVLNGSSLSVTLADGDFTVNSSGTATYGGLLVSDNSSCVLTLASGHKINSLGYYSFTGLTGATNNNFSIAVLRNSSLLCESTGSQIQTSYGLVIKYHSLMKVASDINVAPTIANYDIRIEAHSFVNQASGTVYCEHDIWIVQHSIAYFNEINTDALEEIYVQETSNLIVELEIIDFSGNISISGHSCLTPRGGINDSLSDGSIVVNITDLSWLIVSLNKNVRIQELSLTGICYMYVYGRLVVDGTALAQYSSTLIAVGASSTAGTLTVNTNSYSNGIT